MANKVLLNDIPRRCVKCDAVVFTGAPRPKISKKAFLIGAVGMGVNVVWVILFVLFSPVYVTPRGELGILICIFIYGWPFYVSLIIARLVPPVVVAKCYSCKHTESYSIVKPKL